MRTCVWVGGSLCKYRRRCKEGGLPQHLLLQLLHHPVHVGHQHHLLLFGPLHLLPTFPPPTVPPQSPLLPFTALNLELALPLQDQAAVFRSGCVPQLTVWPISKALGVRGRGRGAGCQRQPAESRGVELPPSAAAASILLSLSYTGRRSSCPDV